MIGYILAKFRTYVISIENWKIKTNDILKNIMTIYQFMSINS